MGLKYWEERSTPLYTVPGPMIMILKADLHLCNILIKILLMTGYMLQIKNVNNILIYTNILSDEALNVIKEILGKE